MDPEACMSFAGFRCFEDSVELQVRTVGTWLPMTICGMATIICACLRMLAIAMHIIWLGMRGKERYDIIILDQACPHRRPQSQKDAFYLPQLLGPTSTCRALLQSHSTGSAGGRQHIRC